MRFEDDLIASLQPEAGRDDRISLGGVPGEADLVGVGTHETGRGLAIGLEEPVPVFTVMGLGGCLLTHGIQNDLWRGAKTAGVQIDAITSKREQRPDFIPGQFLGVRYRRRGDKAIRSDLRRDRESRTGGRQHT